ncbi:MAG TPA: hypothetical protein VMD31_12775 [Opitutaceae bacterium]|nr:hypothetical protein [Opitutaceae bacterium]
MFVTLGFLPAALPGADAAAAPASPPPKPYTLYLGADLSIERDAKTCPVRGVERNAFVIEVDGKRVPVRNADLQMRIDSALKLTTAYATLGGIRAERVYTPANNPLRREEQAMDLANYNSSVVDEAADELRYAQMMAAAGKMGASDAAGNSITLPLLDSDSEAQFAALQSSLQAQHSELSSAANMAARTRADTCDALYLSFDLSSRQPLEDPYVVAIVRFRENPDNPKSTRVLVYAQALPAINDKPQTVRFFRGGFPPGYQLVDYQIHLYDHGTEIATSAAAKQLAMTTEEAFQFASADYAARNRNQTLPPAPAKAFWPGDLPARLSVKKLDRTLYVKVDKDGRVAGFFDDAACIRPVNDAELEAVRPELHFFPALAKGKSIESVVAFNLGQHVE